MIIQDGGLLECMGAFVVAVRFLEILQREYTLEILGDTCNDDLIVIIIVVDMICSVVVPSTRG